MNVKSELQHFSPWRFLNNQQLDTVCNAGKLEIHTVEKELYRCQDTLDDVFVILEGIVSIDHRSRQSIEQTVKISQHGKGVYFGERASLFEECRRGIVTALKGSTIFRIPGSVFLEMVGCNLAFARALARTLRWKQQIFAPIDRFTSYIMSAISQSTLSFDILVDLYKQMIPALHSRINEKEVDVAAWQYAIARLPENITSVSTVILSTKKLKLVDGHNQFIETSARRRTTQLLLEGKIFVLLRDVVSDFIDFATNLCLHSVESRKLRRKIANNCSTTLVNALVRIKSGELETHEMRESVLDSLNTLTAKEKDGLKALWPNSLVTNIYNILYQYGDFNMILSAGINRYEEDISERWTQRVILAAREILQSSDFERFSVDIISSNVHSVVNILSPYIHSRRTEILEWGRGNMSEFMNEALVGEQDMPYILARHFFKAFPDKALEREEMEKKHGFVTIMEDANTGVTVQMIDPSKLSTEYHDDYLDVKNAESKPDLIVNINYAFGHQAEDIANMLILIFGKSIRSVNVLGKAGALLGERGDVLMPTHVVLQAHEELRSVTNSGLDPLEIASLSNRTVHTGPVLTIEGTLLQDRTLLLYYKKLWNVIGLEMEGSYYVKAIERGVMGGMLKPTVDTRFLYYVSDTPLAASESTLSAGLRPWEGIPPLYATTRVILAQIFKRSAPEEKLPSAIASSSNRALAVGRVMSALRVINALSFKNKK